MSDDLNLSGPEKFLKSIGTTLEEVGTWLKGIGLSLFGGSEPTTTEQKPEAGDKGKKKAESEENEQEQGEAEEQAKAEEKIKAEQKAKAEEEALAQEKAQAEEKARAQAEQLKNQAEGDLAALQKIVEGIVETKLQQPVAEGLAKLKSGLEAALKIEALPERSSALGSLVQEIGTGRSDAEAAAKESEKLVEIRKRVAQVQSQAESAISEVEKTVLSIGETSLQEAQTQQLEGLKKRLSTAMSQTDPTVQEQEIGTLLVDIEKQKEEANTAKLKSDEIIVARERIAQLQKQVETALVEAGKVVDLIAEASLKDPEALKLEELKKRQTTAINLKDLDTQEKDFNTLLGEITKFKDEADIAKKASDEVAATRLRVETSKKQVELDLTALKQVVDGIAETTLQKPCAEALDKLNKSLESALKLATPAEQETALTDLGKQLALDRQAADKAAKESAEIVEQRKRVTDLKEKAEKELAELEILVGNTASNTRKEKLKKVKEEISNTDKLTDLKVQEKEYPKRSKEIALLKKDCEKFIKIREEYENGYNSIKSAVENAVKAVDGNPRLPNTEATAFRDIHKEVLAQVKKRGFTTAKSKLPALKKAAEEINKIAKDGEKFYKALAKLEADINEANDEADLKEPAPTEDMLTVFEEARDAMNEAIEDKDWVEAESALGDLEAAIGDMQQARTEKDSFEKAMMAIQAEMEEADSIGVGPGVPDAYWSAFQQAGEKLQKKMEERDWTGAEGKLPKLKVAADAILEVAKRGAAYYSAFEKIRAEFDEAEEIIEDDDAPPKDVAEAFEKAQEDLQGEVDGEEWDEAIKLIPAVQKAAQAVQAEKVKYDDFDNEYSSFADDAVKGAARRGMLPDAELKEFKAADALVDEAYDDRDWLEATARLAALKKASLVIQQILKEGETFFNAFAAIEDDYDRAIKVKADKVLTDTLKTQLENSRNALTTHSANKAWDQAFQVIPLLRTTVLAVNKADDDRNAYEEKFEAFREKYNVAILMVRKAGMADPEGANWIEANSAMMKAEGVKDWALALTKCGDVQVAVDAVVKVLEDPGAEDYYNEFYQLEDEYKQAVTTFELKADKLDLLSRRFLDARDVAQKAAKKKDFTVAKDALPALKKAVDELTKAAEEYKKEKTEFDQKFNKIADLAAAQKIVAQPPKKLVPGVVKDFRDLYVPFNDAKNAGDFDTAAKAIDGLQLAITALVNANATYLSERSTYESERLKIAELAAAEKMAAGGSANPVIVDKIGPFDLAKKAVDDAVALEDWAGAKDKLSELEDAATELLEAEKLADGADAPKQAEEWNKRMSDTALKSRTDAASDSDQVKYIEALQEAVQKQLSAVNGSIAKGEYAKAEIEYKKLLSDLSAMESAKTAYEEHFKKFDAAEKGEVDKARKLSLVPPKLAKQRTDALKASEKRILQLAAKGKLAKADKEVAAWVNEAKAWKASKAAYDNLNDQLEPDPVKLKSLATMPGGGKVLDALMAELPEDKPQKFMKEAMTARFGFGVKQFAKKDPEDLENLPSKQISKELPDKSLKKLYDLMAKLPEGNVKGQIKQLIRFDENAGGAAFTGGTKKIVWMYCGRADDPAGSKQKFNQPGTIMPEGEEVELDFQAVDSKEVPYFDFATLHEVGHAVESQGASLMANAGWQVHTADDIAAKAAAHFGYDLDFVKTMLADPKSAPPPDVTTVPTSSNPAQWAKSRDAVVDWCQSVRVSNAIWNKPGVSKQLAISGRVYQEAYKNDWVSYDISARSKGISAYQFRSSGEWFAELYAAYFSKKLKKTHPYAPALKLLKNP